jgi:peptidoglycan/xylan/chitin deacetylase (PgdA/CDA1 family)
MIRGKRANHYVALTFDDGPHRTRTPMVLDTLDRHGVPATFFVVGHRLAGKSERADERRQIATDIVRRGHDLGNHTYRHSNLRALSARQARREIERGERYIRRVLGHRSYLFRAPYGAWAASGYLRARGYTRVGWTFDVRDFWDRGDLATRLLDQIERHQGGITVLHDTHEGTARSLSKLLSQLEVRNCARLERGLRPIVPVSLHYFMTTAEGRPRPLPAHAIRREASYLRRLAASCRRFDKQPQGH